MLTSRLPSAGRRKHGVHLAGLDQQRDVLHRPAPPLRPVHQGLLLARAGAGPLWAGRDSGAPPAASHAPILSAATRLNACPVWCRATRAGGAGKVCPSRRRGIRWSASSWPARRRWSTRSAPKRAYLRRQARMRERSANAARAAACASGRASKCVSDGGCGHGSKETRLPTQSPHAQLFL